MAGAADNHICEARRFGEASWCGRCGLGPVKPDELVCKSAAQCGLTASIIREALEAAAADLDASIDAAHRVSPEMSHGGHGPDAGLLRRAAALRAAVRFVDHHVPKRGASNG